MPCSGPASAYGVIGRVEAAYFHTISDAGGIHGRKINFIPTTTPTVRLRP
jgi:branched-chain amino acid transport system substrate-binding protein